MKTIPMIDIRAANEPLREELLGACARVLDGGCFILGEHVEAFETQLAEYLGVEHTLGVSSGTDALLLALMALGIGPGDEVLCPSFTFFATAGVVARVGARPVFVDSCPHCYSMDPHAARRLISSRTKAIIPVHLFGQPADLSSLMALAQEHGLYVIEDCAQALGASFDNRPVGSLGHFGTFSFYPTKTLSGLGEAGLISAQDPVLFKKVHMLRNHGSSQRYHHELIGGNFRMDALQGALLGVKFKHLEAFNADRQAQAQCYSSALSALPGVLGPELDPYCCGKDLSVDASTQVILPGVHPGRSSVWSLYTVRVLHGARDALAAHLHAAGIFTDVYYPKGLHRQPCFVPYAPASQLPCVDTLSQQVLSLPLYPGLSTQDQDRVVDALRTYLEAISKALSCAF